MRSAIDERQSAIFCCSAGIGKNDLAFLIEARERFLIVEPVNSFSKYFCIFDVLRRLNTKYLFSFGFRFI